MILKRVIFFGSALAVFFAAVACEAAFLVEVDTDGLDDGTVTYHPNFSFGGDTTMASQSSESTAFGMTGGDSIFGGDGVSLLDTYVVTYSPAGESDNLMITAGTDLGEGDLASGVVGGGAGKYTVFATWPFTMGVSGGLTRYTVETTGDSFVVDVNQNDADNQGDVDGRGNVWVRLGEIDYASGEISVTQQPTDQNSFVSMRLAGILFEKAIPEPAACSLMVLGTLSWISGARRRKI